MIGAYARASADSSGDAKASGAVTVKNSDIASVVYRAMRAIRAAASRRRRGIRLNSMTRMSPIPFPLVTPAMKAVDRLCPKEIR